MEDSLNVMVCPPEDRALALGIILQNFDPAIRNARIDEWLHSDADSKVSLDSLMVCLRKGHIVGAMLAVDAPGRTLMVWRPRTRPEVGDVDETQVARVLLCEAGNIAKRRRARFVQLLLEESDPSLERALQDEHYAYLTTLLYLRRPVSFADERIPPCRFELVSYSDQTHDDFVQVIERTYRQSQDCPELTGVRSMDDVMESHQGTGMFEARRWKLARKDSEWLGCLLLNAGGDGTILEIAYVATTPEARGRGVGQDLVREAIRMTWEEGFQELVLAVDERNQAARRIYDKLGFECWGSRQIHLLVLDPADGRIDRTIPRG